MNLFEIAPEYWARLSEVKQRIMALGKNAHNTHKAYAHTWQIFTTWCETVRASPLPAAAETINDFVAWCLYVREPRYRVGTVTLALSAIRFFHEQDGKPNPVTRETRLLARNAKRDLREKRRCKRPLKVEQLRKICRYWSERGPKDEIALRDRAMTLMQFASGWRASEVIGLRLDDVEFGGRGYSIRLGASKGDQEGKLGRITGVEYGHGVTCPVRALKAYLKVRGDESGQLFRPFFRPVGDEYLIGDVINERLKIALEAVGIGAENYGSHSLRAGMVTIAIERGAPETAIMLRTGHKSLSVMQGYVREASAFPRAYPLAGVL